MIPRLFALALVLTIFGAIDAQAFDGDRAGFVLGFGAGPGKMFVTSSDLDFTGLQTDLVLGSGLDSQTILHYTGKQFWHSERDVFYSQAYPLLGVTRYFEPQGPSAFVTGGAGASILVFVAGEEPGVATGLAAFAGGGYEFARHWNVEVDVIGTWPEGIGLYNVSLTLHILGY